MFFVIPIIVSLEPASGTVLQIVHFYIGDGHGDLTTIAVQGVEQPWFSRRRTVGRASIVPGDRRAEGIGDRVLLVPEVQPRCRLKATRVVSPGEQVSVLAQRAAGRYEGAYSCQGIGRIKTQDVKAADSALAMRINDYACYVWPGQQPA